MRIGRGIAAGIAGLAVLLAPAAALAQLSVVVSSKPIHSLVAAVMDGVGTAQVLVDGANSPHTYAMKPSDAKALAGANVFFRMSESLEPFTGKLMKSLPKSVQVVTLQDAPGVTLLDKREGGTFEADGHGGKGHDHDKKGAQAKDPHVWLDPANAKAMARQIASVLAEKSPGDAARLSANADALAKRLDALDAEMERELAPYSGRPILVFHDAYQYLERRYGLNVAGSITVSPDVQPGAKRLSELRGKVVKLGAICAFIEPQLEGKAVNAVIEGTPSRVSVLDPEGQKLAAGPDLYFKLMRGLAASVKTCMG